MGLFLERSLYGIRFALYLHLCAVLDCFYYPGLTSGPGSTVCSGPFFFEKNSLMCCAPSLTCCAPSLIASWTCAAALCNQLCDFASTSGVGAAGAAAGDAFSVSFSLPCCAASLTCCAASLTCCAPSLIASWT